MPIVQVIPYLPHVIMFSIDKGLCFSSGLFFCVHRWLGIHHKAKKCVVWTMGCQGKENVK